MQISKDEERIRQYSPSLSSSRHTDCHDPQTPNVDLGAVLFASDDLGSHPVGRTDHRGPLGVGWIRDLGAETKVGCEANSQVSIFRPE